jgi:predicted amidophosphoribosyltransferase
VEIPRALLGLVLPLSCAGCGCAGALMCGSCQGALARAAADPLGRTAPRPMPPGFPPAAAAAPYAGAVRGALLAHKERGRLRLAGPLGLALAAAVRCVVPHGPVVLVPVPSSRRVVRQRGHDHARRLAASAARHLGPGAAVVRLLAPARSVADQSGLDSRGRALNVGGAFRAVAPARSGPPVVVVDDVVTTGATLVEAVRALAAVGHSAVLAATVAATVRRGPVPTT